MLNRKITNYIVIIKMFNSKLKIYKTLNFKLLEILIPRVRLFFIKKALSPKADLNGLHHIIKLTFMYFAVTINAYEEIKILKRQNFTIKRQNEASNHG